MAARITKPTRRPRSADRPALPAADGPVLALAPARPEPTADDVRLLAYHKWLAAGSPPGDGVDFWLEAERELQRPA